MMKLLPDGMGRRLIWFGALCCITATFMPFQGTSLWANFWMIVVEANGQAPQQTYGLLVLFFCFVFTVFLMPWMSILLSTKWVENEQRFSGIYSVCGWICWAISLFPPFIFMALNMNHLIPDEWSSISLSLLSVFLLLGGLLALASRNAGALRKKIFFLMALPVATQLIAWMALLGAALIELSSNGARIIHALILISSIATIGSLMQCVGWPLLVTSKPRTLTSPDSKSPQRPSILRKGLKAMYAFAKVEFVAVWSGPPWPPSDFKFSENQEMCKLAQAAWFNRFYSRTPLFLLLGFGLALSVMACFLEYGRSVARADIIIHQADWEKRAPIAVPDVDNAALVWQKATAESLPKLESLPRNQRVDWSSLAVYSKDSDIRKWLVDRKEVISQMSQAAEMDACSWGGKPKVFKLQRSDFVHFGKFLKFQMILQRRVLLASHDQEWEKVFDSLRLMRGFSNHLESERPLWSALAQGYVLAEEALLAQYVFMGATAKPPFAVVERLLKIFKDFPARLKRCELAVAEDVKISGNLHSSILGAARFNRFVEEDGWGANYRNSSALLGAIISLYGIPYPLASRYQAHAIEREMDKIMNRQSGVLPEPFSELNDPFGRMALRFAYFYRRVDGVQFKNAYANYHVLWAGLQALAYQKKHSRWPRSRKDADGGGAAQSYPFDNADILNWRIEADGSFTVWNRDFNGNVDDFINAPFSESSSWGLGQVFHLPAAKEILIEASNE